MAVQPLVPLEITDTPSCSTAHNLIQPAAPPIAGPALAITSMAMPQQISAAPGPSQLPQPPPLLEMPEDKPDSPPSGALCNTLVHVLKLTNLHVALAIRAAAHRSGASSQQQLPG